jgi:hypothetical protein
MSEASLLEGNMGNNSNQQPTFAQSASQNGPRGDRAQSMNDSNNQLPDIG